MKEKFGKHKIRGATAFISHMVQMKEYKNTLLYKRLTFFISHMVQMKEGL